MHSNKKFQCIPHASAVLKCIGTTIEPPQKMAMHFVPLFLALIQKRQFEQSPDVRALARQSYEKRHERSVILNALAIWVEIYCPCIATDNKGIGRDELADSHALGERVPIDFKLVAAINGLCARGRARDRWRQRR